MKRLLMLTLLALCCAPASLAQTPNREYPRFEFYAGYSFNNFDFNSNVSPVATVPDGLPMDLGRGRLHGFDVSVSYNATRHVAVKGVFTASFAAEDFFRTFPLPCDPEDAACFERERCKPGDTRPQCTICVIALTCPDNPVGFTRESSLYQFLGGVQLRDNSRETRVKPFAHLLAGGARLSQTFYPNPDDPDSPDCPACTRFSFDRTGFALDVGGGLDVRLSQRLDLRVFQVTYNPTFFSSGTQHNLRAGAGLGFH